MSSKTNFPRNCTVSTLCVLACLASGSARAVTSITTTFQATLTISMQCVITNASTLDFGANGVLATNVDLATTVSVICTNLSPYNVGLDGGQFGTDVNNRKMQGGPANELIGYSLSTNAARSTNWGNTIGTDTVSATGTGTAQTFTIYGRVPPQATPRPGAYADTVTMTVTY